MPYVTDLNSCSSHRSLRASTVRYERGIGGHNVRVTACRSVSVTIACRLWRQLRPYCPLVILWYAWLSKPPKASCMRYVYVVKASLVTDPPCRVPYCPLLSSSSLSHIIILTSLVTYQARDLSYSSKVIIVSLGNRVTGTGIRYNGVYGLQQLLRTCTSYVWLLGLWQRCERPWPWSQRRKCCCRGKLSFLVNTKPKSTQAQVLILGVM
jgi:hypothetical protein